MTEAKTHITAAPGDIAWRYERPANTGAKMMLLTVGRVAVLGTWFGDLGEAFIAWAPMPKRDKIKEVELGL